MEHPIFNVLINSDMFTTPNALRFLCHQAYINKIDYRAVDDQVLEIGLGVQTAIRALRGVENEEPGILTDVMECGSLDDYKEKISQVYAEILEESGKEELTEYQLGIIAFLVSFGVELGGEFHEPNMSVDAASEIYEHFYRQLDNITSPDLD